MKNLTLKILAANLVLQILFFGSWYPAHAQETTCPPHTHVQIDIKPGDEPNAINLSSKGLLPVALLTTDMFDASLFTPQKEHVHLSDAGAAMGTNCVGANPERWNLDDVNGDGRLDLVFFFRIRDLNLNPDSTSATLMAHGAYGSDEVHIMGMDAVVVKP